MATSRKIRVGIVAANPSRGFASIAHIPALQELPASLRSLSSRKRAVNTVQTASSVSTAPAHAREGGRLIATSGPKSAVVLESSLADNIASPANDIERGGLLRIANPNRRGRWQSCGKTALVSFGRSRR
jgi:hypothetical protein